MRLGSLRPMTDRVRIDGPSDSELSRIRDLLTKIGGPHVQWGAQQILDVWVAEARLEAERRASARMLTATWVLAAATVALVFATVGLIVAGA